MLVGQIEEYCEEKFNEYYGKPGIVNKTKTVMWGLAGGVPMGLMIGGIELLTVGICGALMGKKLGFVEK